MTVLLGLAALDGTTVEAATEGDDRRDDRERRRRLPERDRASK